LSRNPSPLALRMASMVATPQPGSPMRGQPGQVVTQVPANVRMVTVQSPVKVLSPSAAANGVSPTKVNALSPARGAQVIRVVKNGYQAPAPVVVNGSSQAGSFSAVAPGSIRMAPPLTAQPVVNVASPVKRVPVNPAATVRPQVVAQAPAPAAPRAAAPARAAAVPTIVTGVPVTQGTVKVVEQVLAKPKEAAAISPTKAKAAAPTCCFAFAAGLKDISPLKARPFVVGRDVKVKATGTRAKITHCNGHAFKVAGKWHLAEELA